MSDEPRSERDREVLLIALGIAVTIIAIVAFWLFIKSSGSDAPPAHTGNVEAAAPVLA